MRQLALSELPDLQEPTVYGPLKHIQVDLAGPFPYFTRLADGTIKQPVSKPKGRPPADATQRAEFEAQLRYQYMHRVHSATNITPIEYLLGFKPQLPLPVGSSYHLVSLR